MIYNFNRWWFHIWQRPAWVAIGYLFLVALRALMVGGGILFLLSDMPTVLRAIIAAVVGSGLSVATGILGMRARLEEDW